MPLNDLHQFITSLEANHELHRITAEVDPLLEIAAITNRVCKQANGGAALFFEHPTGSRFPVATNLFGSVKRVCLALGITNLAELTERLQTLLDRIPGFDLHNLDRQLAALPEFTRFSPNATSEPDPDQIPMSPPDLERFPFLHSWPDDGSAEGHPHYITLPQIITADPDGGTPNCGVYRVQLRGKREAAIQWKAGSGAAKHAEQYRSAGKPMPVAIVLGGDHALLFSAMFPLPGELDELTFAGFLRKTPLTTAPCRTVPLQVPLGAEIVIEGFVTPGETVIEGPFGNHTGFYSPAAPAALLRVTAISCRHNAVIPATVVGPPPMEDCWMALAWERLLLTFVQKKLPAIADIHFPAEWVFHQSAIISLENIQPGMVRNIAETLWALPWFVGARLLVFVTAGEPAGLSRTAWRFINVTNLGSDIYYDEATGRCAVDATGWHDPRQKVTSAPDSQNLVAQRWKEYGIE
jgi:4-hydroxy-3-polyprenylbenzoate decarboxylase